MYSIFKLLPHRQYSTGSLTVFNIAANGRVGKGTISLSKGNRRRDSKGETTCIFSKTAYLKEDIGGELVCFLLKLLADIEIKRNIIIHVQISLTLPGQYFMADLVKRYKISLLGQHLMLQVNDILPQIHKTNDFLHCRTQAKGQSGQ